MINPQANVRDKATAANLHFNFLNGYILESTQKSADKLRVAFIDLFVYGFLPVEFPITKSTNKSIEANEL